MLPNYLQSPIWWMGITTMVIGEVCNFAAYTFAPAILVTPLGALSVIIGAILASILLDERLGRLGVCGCAACLIGSVVIILHAPADKDVQTVDEILDYASQPGEFGVAQVTMIWLTSVQPSCSTSPWSRRCRRT